MAEGPPPRRQSCWVWSFSAWLLNQLLLTISSNFLEYGIVIFPLNLFKYLQFRQDILWTDAHTCVACKPTGSKNCCFDNKLPGNFDDRNIRLGWWISLNFLQNYPFDKFSAPKKYSCYHEENTFETCSKLGGKGTLRSDLCVVFDANAAIRSSLGFAYGMLWPWSLNLPTAQGQKFFHMDRSN